MSLNSLLPKLSTERDPDSELWDLCSIASLSRNILEAYLVVYYSGTESISDEEAELRFSSDSYIEIESGIGYTKKNSDVKLLKEFEDGMKEQKLRIKEHPYLNSLTVPQKNKALKGDEMYYTKADFESKNEICNGLSLDFQLLSNFVHPLPLSIERIDNDRGRGESNIYDLTYSLACLKIATKYLAASTVSVVDNFPEELGKRFKLLIDPIRVSIR